MKIQRRHMLKRPYLIVTITFGMIMVYHTQKLFFGRSHRIIHKYAADDIGFRDTEVTCKFPIYHPFDESILPYVETPEPLKCRSDDMYLMGILGDGYLSWNDSSGFIQDDFSCEYSEISEANSKTVYGPTLKYTKPVKLNSDFVFVQCKNIWGFPSYMDYFSQVVKNSSVREFNNDSELGVIVIGMDSMSRLNMMRQLPKTYHFMKTVLGSNQMLGYNKVGQNTFPNVMAMLTGGLPPPGPHGKFEKWKFIWDYFADAGAATLYAEDQPHINMFKYNGEGLDRIPTHHYEHTFWLATEHSVMEGKSSVYCLGSRPKHKIHFNYILSFLRAYKNSPKFVFSLINEPCHNFVNVPGIMDDDLLNMMKTAYDEGLFNRSIVFVLSDHGNRMDWIRQTELGKIEDNMPLMSVIVPPWVKTEWKESVKVNTRRLITAFDLYKTFVHVLSTLNSPHSNFKEILTSLSDRQFGSSLLTPISANLTCDTAGIADWYCSCEKDVSVPLPVSDLRASDVSKFLVNYINSEVSKWKCQPLALKSIVKSSYESLSPHVDRVSVTIQTIPGDGIFEASINVEREGGKKRFIRHGPILRTNMYGNQSGCVPLSLASENKLILSACFCY